MKSFQSTLICGMLAIGWVSLSAESNADELPAQNQVPIQVTLLDQVEVPARDAGELEHLEVREGAFVREGTLLGNLNQAKEKLQVEQATLDLQIAERNAKSDVKIRFTRKALEVAQKEYERSLEAVRKYPKSISQTELDFLKLTSEKAALELEQAETDKETAELESKAKKIILRQADLALSKRKIYAPFAGKVTQLFSQRGEWVNPGDKIMRIVRLDKLRAEGLISALQASKMKEGKELLVEIALGDGKKKTVTATITFIHPEANPIDGQIRFWAEIDNKKNTLRPGLRGVLKLEVK